MLELLADLYSDFAIAVSRSTKSQFAQKPGLLLECQAFPVFMVGGELVFQVIEGEREALR